MFYNPRNKNVVSIKSEAMVAESISAFVQNRTQYSATESLDDPIVEKKTTNSLKEYIIAQAFATIADASVFFSRNPEEAYSELIGLLNDPHIREQVIEYLGQRFNCLVDADATPEELEKREAYYRNYFAQRKVDGLRSELDSAERHLRDLDASTRQKYPGLLETDEE